MPLLPARPVVPDAVSAVAVASPVAPTCTYMNHIEVAVGFWKPTAASAPTASMLRDVFERH